MAFKEYNLVQDAFNDGLIEKIRLLSYLKDVNGDYVLTGTDKTPLDNLTFACCTRTEFVNQVLERLNGTKKFPFIFIESGDNIKYKSDFSNRAKVEIKEIFLCTLSNKVLLADERDRISFNTILFPLKKAFFTVLTREPLRITNPDNIEFSQYHSYITSESNFDEKLDVIILKNIELELTKKCNN